MLTMRSSADDMQMTYMPADDVQMTYPPVDDVLDNICHLPAKSPMKSHYHVICMSSTHRLHVVRTRFQPQKYFHLKSRQLC